MHQTGSKAVVLASILPKLHSGYARPVPVRCAQLVDQCVKYHICDHAEDVNGYTLA
jgi:hypothetical protein